MHARVCNAVFVLSLFTGTIFFFIPFNNAHAGPGFGPRIGLSGGDDFFVGVHGEFGQVMGTATLAPSLDLRIGDSSAKTANLDLRWYLLPLPETGLRLYGAAGPTVLLSPSTELGLSLTLGVHIPMKAGRRYNLEYRFGLGDIPEHKIALSVLFGI
ncbi:MAG: hypothetical protein KOO60_11355 [Gemmatimonadales bacterium]|nr:hypothetical protein [Gemmatimonadales bacterium]